MTDVLVTIEGSGVSTWLRESESIWALPTILTFHTLGLAVLVGCNWAFDLRVLGIGRSIPLAPFRSMFPLMWTGLAINGITGVLLFAADASDKATSAAFLTKMFFVAVGVAALVLLRKHVGGNRVDTDQASSTARLLAAVSIVAWTAAISAGRLLAYI